MRFGVSTWLWESPFSTASVSLFPKIRKMGFDAVEIPVEDPMLIDASVVKEALEENGLEALVCGVFGPSKDLTHEDTSVHDNCFRYLDQCFDLCNSWGATFVAGPMYSAVGKARMVPGEQRKREWELAVSNLRTVCNMAQERGLFVAIEPLNRFESDLVNTAADVMRLIKDINHNCARVLLDGFHMTIEETNLREAITSVGDKLLHVQVSENHRGIPGTGLTAWEEFRSGLEEVGYRGVVSIESFTPEIKELAGAVCIWKHLAANQDDFARQGVGFLKNLFNR
jgi:D-psicose/D-tagatose/L-ribulose 3-epimerase